ncbi:MAG TPA: hypothetical protein VFL31_06845, partial [Nitrospiraceae bacterium]|nr:hypothetical protein [Nitrospiraceae bacterium]
CLACLTGSQPGVYQDYMDRSIILRQRGWLILFLASMVAGTLTIGEGLADEFPFTKNVPIPEFQNRQEDVRPYNFDAPPEGIFRSIQFAEGFEEEMGFRRTHEIVPVSPTEIFRPDSRAIFVVFQVHQHYESFQVFGLCFPEQVDGLEPKTVIAQDVMYLALEDESGYVKLHAPQGGWKPGKYKVEIHIGWKVNDISLVGTMRFSVASSNSTTANSGLPASPK